MAVAHAVARHQRVMPYVWVNANSQAVAPLLLSVRSRLADIGIRPRNKRGTMTAIDERVIWQSYPSWRHFVWLYFFSLMAGFRGALFIRFGVEGGPLWLLGAGLLLLCAAVVRHWAKYLITSRRVIVTNGYTGRAISVGEVAAIDEITVSRGPIARWLGIGTLVIRFDGKDRVLSLRGITDPEIVRTKLEALRPRSPAAAISSSP